MSAPMKDKQSFEDSLKRLEEIVQTMESSELSIESLTKIFEEGLNFLSESKQQLANAELQILNAGKNINFNQDSEDDIE